jgi:hypothetical protein
MGMNLDLLPQGKNIVIVIVAMGLDYVSVGLGVFGDTMLRRIFGSMKQEVTGGWRN